MTQPTDLDLLKDIANDLQKESEHSQDIARIAEVHQGLVSLMSGGSASAIKEAIRSHNMNEEWVSIMNVTNPEGNEMRGFLLQFNQNRSDMLRLHVDTVSNGSQRVSFRYTDGSRLQTESASRYSLMSKLAGQESGVVAPKVFAHAKDDGTITVSQPSSEAGKPDKPAPWTLEEIMYSFKGDGKGINIDSLKNGIRQAAGLPVITE